jgi:hypothetical protein
MEEFNPKKAELYQLTRSHDLFERENPRSLINIAPEVFQAGLEHSSVRLYLRKDEKSLEKIVKPTPTLNRLRQRFWIEYDLAQDQKRSMQAENIWMGICSLDLFLSTVEKYKYQAWILMPLPRYDDVIEEALHAGLNRVREIFEFPLYEKKAVKRNGVEQIITVPNYKAADLMLKTVKMLDDRARGGVVQKIEQTNKNLHLHKNADRSVTSVENENDLIEAEIRRLENKISGNKAKVIEAEIVDGTTKEIGGSESSS